MNFSGIFLMDYVRSKELQGLCGLTIQIHWHLFLVYTAAITHSTSILFFILIERSGNLQRSIGTIRKWAILVPGSTHLGLAASAQMKFLTVNTVSRLQ